MHIPQWLQLSVYHALSACGEIYPSIRVVTIKFSEGKILTMRYYLDREPQEIDQESVDMVLTTVFSATTSADQIYGMVGECIFMNTGIHVNPGELVVYARREYSLIDVMTKMIEIPDE